MNSTGSALVVVESQIAKDPRVARQVRWLVDDGWTVDTIGLGDGTAPGVRDHFPLVDTAPWKLTRFGTATIYGLLPHTKKFEVLTLSRVPDEVRTRVREGRYDLIVLNDRHFAPWVTIDKDFTAEARRAHVHLDLHEYFVPTYPRDSLWRIATSSYYEWARAQFAHPRISTRSTVNTGIAQLYAQELGIPAPAIVRNSPTFEDLAPSAVDPGDIRLVYHGLARWDRGLRLLVDAMPLLDERFSLTLILVGDKTVIGELRRLASSSESRIEVLPGVPVDDIARAVNRFDLEVMFYPPANRNLEYALPNKLFEAVQGRVGLVIGDSPMMRQVVEEWGNGVVVDGWHAADLARSLNAVSADDVERMKTGSHRAARSLHADTEASVFRQIVRETR